MPKKRHSIMLSSTYKELKEHRAAVSEAALGQGMFPLDMANDSALPDKDLISASLAKVDEADAYVGLISYRYGQMPECAVRNPNKLSLTELEFRCAQERGLPICMFIMHGDHPVPRSAVNGESGTADKLAAFVALAKRDRIYAEFQSVDDLKGKVIQTLARLRDVLSKNVRRKPTPVVAKRPPTSDIPLPPVFYAKPPYLPGYAFQGRVKELSALKDWAASADPVLIFEAIGGMGKSMVNWEWVTKHTVQDRDWAGILWYSFYERGADMKDFCVTALSYMSRRPREDLRARPSFELASELLTLLRDRPWLLVLDGLERVLVAYHRSDAAQLRDEDVETSTGATGGAPTNCIHPDDDDLLRQLCAAGPSKLLMSSRLMPRVLLNALGQPVPGVRRFHLLGLDARDAELMLRAAGITGDAERMQRYLEQRFGCHPLVVGVVGGLVVKHLKTPGNFDHWVDDPDGGAAVNLADPDIKQRQHHILKLAFDGLGAQERDLLTRIAMIANAVDWDTLEALNPVRPLPPKFVREPTAPDMEGNSLHVYLLELLAAAETSEPAEELEQISKYQRERQESYQTEREKYADYQSALAAWTGLDAVRAAPRWLNAALLDLETRGLLQCDRQDQKFDLHPVVRGYAIGSLNADALAQTGQQVADYFSSRPKPAYEAAATLLDLGDAIQTVQALNLAGNTHAAWKALDSGLWGAMWRLECHHQVLELLRPLFPNGWLAMPSDVGDLVGVVSAAELTLGGIGYLREAAAQLMFGIQEFAKRRMINGHLAYYLANHSETAWYVRGVAQSERILGLAHSERILNLADDVAVAAGSERASLWCKLNMVSHLTGQGRLTEARILWTDIEERLLAVAKNDHMFEASTILDGADLRFREGALTKDHVREALSRVSALGRRYYERGLWSLSGRWHQSNGNESDAVDAFTRSLEMAQAAGLRDTEAEAGRGLSLARLGRRQAAEPAAASAERDPPHSTLAELYLALGNREKARHRALAGYKQYWADGPPYAFHWELRTCRNVLQALGEPEPAMPPFDPAKIAPIVYEADIRRLLAEHAANQRSTPPATA